MKRTEDLLKLKTLLAERYGESSLIDVSIDKYESNHIVLQTTTGQLVEFSIISGPQSGRYSVQVESYPHPDPKTWMEFDIPFVADGLSAEEVVVALGKYIKGAQPGAPPDAGTNGPRR